MNIIVTGGAGFIGSALVRFLIAHTQHTVMNVDKLTYASNLNSLASVENNDRYSFVQGDICDKALLGNMFDAFKPDLIMHLAAETHVDNSINASSDFIQTNIIGTYQLLEVSRIYWLGLSDDKKHSFRFHHISTDEVYGELGEMGQFSETSRYQPSSPYSASKASSDHLVNAWYRTYGLPTIITNCSNNYGPFQFPEKLIPLTILNALNGKSLPVYGKGEQIRDWLYVDDHVKALYLVATNGLLGETYNIGGNQEKRNIDVVQMICSILEDLAPLKPEGVKNYSDLIDYVEDRPGHDFRYAIDAEKISQSLGWQPEESFESGLKKTVTWFINNQGDIK
tara:strand:+ start:35577 stop:36590 length:1014 start_codon:yes stop_codon:yes gene_type:complete